jgi:hypothetical protein
VSGRLTATLAAAINSAGNLITDVVNPRLDSASKFILSDFDFGATDYAGAVKSGTIAWNPTTGVITGGSGVAIYRGGIVGAAGGVATFTINAATGAATFAGTLSAPTGNIGGWTINSTTLVGGNATLDSTGQLILGTVNDVVVLSAADATYRIWIGNATAAGAAFNVTKAGAMSATGATITGTITATAGAIGGFNIGTDYIRDVADNTGMASTVTGGDDVRFWAGATFANRAIAPFFVTEAGNITANNATIIGTISGRLTATVAATINSAGNVVTDLINARLDTSAKTMLSDFSFGASDYSGALKSGTITWNTTTGALTGGSGVLVFRGGIIGAAAGVATFTIDAATGAATFAGALSAPTGNIGGFNLGADYIRDVANSMGLASTVSGGDDVRFWAGDTFANRATAPFRVTEAGNLVATSATISGTITATTGTIGGFDVGSDYIRDAANSMGLASTVTGGDDVRFWAGATFANRATAPFRVTEAGVLVASNATISGTVTSTNGTIGGFTLSSTAITAGSGDSRVELASNVSGKPENSALILGNTSSLTHYTYLGRGGLWMTWAGAPLGDDYPGVQLYVDSAASGEGVLELSVNTASGPNIRLDGSSGDGTFSGGLLVNSSVVSPGSGNTNVGCSVEYLGANGSALYVSRADNACGVFNRNGDGSLVLFAQSGTFVGSVSITSTNTAYNISSDGRIKTNIVDAPDVGSIIDSMNVREFEFIRDPGRRVMGFIAQELYAVFPAAVTPGDSGEEVTELWQMDRSAIVPILVREIQSLRARLAAAGI